MDCPASSGSFAFDSDAGLGLGLASAAIIKGCSWREMGVPLRVSVDFVQLSLPVIRFPRNWFSATGLSWRGGVGISDAGGLVLASVSLRAGLVDLVLSGWQGGM